MAGQKVKLKDQLGRVVRVGSDAAGATVGKDLRWPDGTVVKPSDIRNPSTDTGSTGGLAATVWKLIREIPANIQKLAKLAGTGFTTRGGDGEWYQRSIAQGEGIAVTNGDGVAGDPTVALAELANAGGGALQKTARDGYGRLAGTSGATTDDLTEGSTNLYFTTGRAAAAAPVQSVTGTGNISVTGTGGNRVVAYQHAWTSIAVTRNSPSRQIITAAAFATVIYNTVVFDRLSEFNTTTGAATVTSTGLYLITAAVHGGPPADGANFAVSIFINGVERARLAEQLASNPTSTQPGAACGGAAQMNLSAGDVITIRMYVGATTSPSTLGVTANFPAGTHLEITRIA